MADPLATFRTAAAADTPADGRREAMARWKRRSQLIRRVRNGLPIAIGVVLLGLLLAIIVAAIQGRRGAEEAQQGLVRMTNPRFVGRTADGRAYELRAVSATRTPGRESQIALESPDLTLSDGEGGSTRVRSRTGLWDETANVVLLTEQVKLSDAAGYAFDTQEARVNLQTNAVSGAKPIAGNGPAGQIAAGGYTLYDQGGRVVFRGGVRARLNRSADAQQGPAPGVAAGTVGEQR